MPAKSIALRRDWTCRRPRGQALVEFALILPLFLMVVFGILILGVGVFYQQQLSNAAREATRYAVLHSATSDCPTVSWMDPDVAVAPKTYYRCDPPATSPPWTYMTAYARGTVFGMSRRGVGIAACWSGYWTKDNLGNWAAHAAPPPNN